MMASRPLNVASGLLPAAWATLLMAAIVSLGCGKGLERAAVNGHVKFKSGEAINRGVIEFTPVNSSSGAAVPGTRSGARIFEGAYAVPAEKGLQPGKYLVRINSASALLGGGGDGGPGSVKQLPQERVSAKFNTDSTLEIEVAPDESVQTFDFEVE